MERDKFFWDEVRSEIEKEINNINKLAIEMKEEKKHGSRRAEGSILHDFYNSCERIFRKIAAAVNGSLPMETAWHKELLYRMTIPIKNLRPAVISEELAAELNEYLSFRHLFRNIYGFELKSEQLDRLVDKFENVTKRFKKELSIFLKKIEEGR